MYATAQKLPLKPILPMEDGGSLLPLLPLLYSSVLRPDQLPDLR
jgi:hypothetical protein